MVLLQAQQEELSQWQQLYKDAEARMVGLVSRQRKAERHAARQLQVSFAAWHLLLLLCIPRFPYHQLTCVLDRSTGPHSLDYISSTRSLRLGLLSALHSLSRRQRVLVPQPRY